MNSYLPFAREEDYVIFSSSLGIIFQRPTRPPGAYIVLRSRRLRICQFEKTVAYAIFRGIWKCDPSKPEIRTVTDWRTNGLSLRTFCFVLGLGAGPILQAVGEFFFLRIWDVL